MPSFLSISCSTGTPWVSQPKRRGTWKPETWACRVTMSYDEIVSGWDLNKEIKYLDGASE